MNLEGGWGQPNPVLEMSPGAVQHISGTRTSGIYLPIGSFISSRLHFQGLKLTNSSAESQSGSVVSNGRGFLAAYEFVGGIGVIAVLLSVVTGG